MDDIDKPARRGARRCGISDNPRRTLAALAVASCFSASIALANPNGMTVVKGTAVPLQAGNLLQITNSPNAVINWQSFSIAAGEITRFVQQSAASAVLNRVTTQNPSQILGALQSNGRVFLINPSGILFGAGAQIDVAGLVASSLNLSDADFLSGRLRFTGTPGAGSVINQGAITTPSGGNVYLVGPAVTNSGIITSPKGEVVLAAGNTVELVDPASPNLRVEISAPGNEAVNLGRITAEAGRIGIYAGLINQRGTINADSVVVGENGSIVLRATKNATLDAGSVTTASGPAGGEVTIQSGDTTMVIGAVEARGAEGKGGTVQVLGNLVGLTGNASVDASGQTGGGTVLVGGDFQGKNPEVQNAFRTYVGPGATVRADAVASGDGGKVIVWADDVTRYYGNISARGGAKSGDGGFVEVSGKGNLEYRGKVSISAPNGRGGTLLLDPTDITLVAAGGTLDPVLDGSADKSILFGEGTGPTLSVGELTAGFTSGDTIILEATNNIDFGLAVALQTGVNLTVTPDADASGVGAFNLSADLSTANLTVNGTFNHTAGALSVTSGNISKLYDYSSSGNLTVNGGTLTLAGGMNWSGTGSIFGAGTTPTLVNASGQTLNVTGNTNKQVSALALNNAGTIVMNMASGSLALNNGTVLSNSGTIDFQATSDNLTNNGGSGTLTNTGTISVTSSGQGVINGSGLTFNNNGGTLSETTATSQLFINPGVAGFYSGTTTIVGNDVQLSGGSHNFATGSIVNGELNVTGAASTFFSGTTQTNGIFDNATTGTLTVSNGTLTLAGGMNWSGTGSIFGAGTTPTLVNASGQTLNVTGNTNKQVSALALNNAGTIVMNMASGSLALNNGTVLSNSGTIDFQATSDNLTNNGGSGTLTNTGTISVTSSGQGVINGSGLTFNNNGGTLSETTATSQLFINPGVAGFYSGTTTIVGNDVQLSGGSHNFATGSIVNGELNVTGAASTFFSGTTQTNGIFDNATTGTLTVSNGTLTLAGGMNWSGTGSIFGAGTTPTLVNASGQTLNVTGNTNKQVSALALNNAGTIVMNMASGSLALNNGTVLSNSGTIDFQATSDNLTNNGGSGTLTNTGTISVTSSGQGVINGSGLTFNNNGGTLSETTATSQLFINPGVAGFYSGTTTIVGNDVQLSGGSHNFATGSIVNGELNVTGAASTFFSGTTQTNGIFDNATTGTLTVSNGTLTLAGGMNWSGTGSIFGAGTTPALAVGSSGTFNISGGNRTLSGFTVNNNGTVVLGLTSGSSLTLDQDTVFNNAGTLSFTQPNISVVAGAGTGNLFNNTGTVSAVLASGTGFLGDGSLRVDSAGGTFSNTGAPLTGLHLTPGLGSQFSGTTTISGTQLVVFAGGEITFTGASPQITGLNVPILGGTNIIVDNGTNLTLNTAASWTGGTISGASAAGSQLTIAPGVFLDVQNGPSTLSNLTVNNTGTVTLGLTAGSSLVLDQDAVFNNAGTLSFTQPNISVVAGAGTGNLFNNTGTVSSVLASGTGFLGDGSLRVDSAGGTFSNTGAPLTGLQLNPGAGSQFSGTTTISGMQLVVFAGGEILFTGASPQITGLNVPILGGTNIIVDNGTNLTLNTATSWTGGTISGASAAGSQLTVAPGVSLDVQNGPLTLSNLTVNNNGTVTLGLTAGSSLVLDQDAVFNNAGTLSFTQPNISVVAGAGTGNLFNNTGTVSAVLASGTGFLGDGSLRVDSAGGTFSNTGAPLTGLHLTPGLGSQFSGTTTISGTQLVVFAGGEITFTGASPQITGLNVPILGGTNLGVANGTNLTLNTFASWTGGTISGASAAGSTFTIAPGVFLDVQGGTRTFGNATLTVNGSVNVVGGSTLAVGAGGLLQGGGTITGAVNNVAGTVGAGMSPGTLTINGNYTQGAAGTMNVEIQGATPGTQHDVLVVTGNAALDGTFNAAYTGGFTPAGGELLNVIQYGSFTGAFAATNLPTGVTDAYLAAQYQLTLPAPPPVVVPPVLPPVVVPTPPAAPASVVVEVPGNEELIVAMERSIVRGTTSKLINSQSDCHKIDEFFYDCRPRLQRSR